MKLRLRLGERHRRLLLTHTRVARAARISFWRERRRENGPEGRSGVSTRVGMSVLFLSDFFFVPSLCYSGPEAEQAPGQRRGAKEKSWSDQVERQLEGKKKGR